MSRLLTTVAHWFSLADQVSHRGLGFARNFADGFLGQALTRDEKYAVTQKIYDGHAKRYRADREVFPWERQWFATRLPPPPASILIGGAGCGREATYLASLGYRITAFEPAPRLYDACRRALPAPHRVLRLSYEEFARLGDGDRDHDHEVLDNMVFDAGLLGWSSFTHVLGYDIRRQVLQAFAQVVPVGPILASFVVASSDSQSTARTLGLRVGKLAWRARISHDSEHDDTFDARFNTMLGFSHLFTREEVAAYAKALKRSVVWEDDPAFPHVSFVIEPA